jgi:hypothetical protein
MDKPAAGAALILGVLLIAVSVPFIPRASAAPSYAITWSEGSAGKAQGPSAASPNTDAMVMLTVHDVAPSNASITFNPCTDAGGNAVNPAATITWTLKADGKDVKGGSGTASCASRGPFTVMLGSHPDVGSAKGPDAKSAAKAAYNGANRTAAEYMLTFRWSRPAGPAPLPLPAAAFSATAVLEIKDWVAAANSNTGAGK